MPAVAVLAKVGQPSVENDQSAEEINKLANYLTNQLHRLPGYKACRDAGLPIGSGAIESSNKHIGHVRLKRSGAWWLEDNGNTMLRLRCALANRTFDKVLKNYISNVTALRKKDAAL